MSQEPNINVFDQIDSICKEFRSTWKQGQKPRIESWLNRIAVDAQPQLFRNLLEIEVKQRTRVNESPSSTEYIQRFPELASQVRQVFDESTLGSMDQVSNHLSEDSVDAVTQTVGNSGAIRIGEYEVVGELGRGGMGVVYEARHQTRNNRVALKTLPTGIDGQEVNADRLHKFRKEFRSLSEINHPNLIGMQTLEVDGNHWFFTMDLIEGVDFLSYVQPGEQLDERRLRSTLNQLALGIIALHEMGIVHRDLKPSNVLVEPSGRVVILDFGLVAQLQTPTDLTVSRSGMFAGTPKYAAPEQMFGERSEASDWYAFGTMLYEALNGQPPFVGQAMELLRQKQTEDPPTIGNIQSLPTDLAQLADQLLKREPSQRPTTAQIVETLKLDLETRTFGSTQSSAGPADSVDETLSISAPAREEEIVLIGREEQLAQLEAAKQQFLESHEPRVVWISGKSGEGKSSLAEKFLGPARQSGDVLVLSGRCYDREMVPFKAIDCWLDALVTYLRRQSKSYLDQVLPEDISWLSQVFPELKRVDAIKKMPSVQSALVGPENLRQLAFGALRELLIRISQQTPIVILIDDLQWGDADSLTGLGRILEMPNAPAIMLLGSYRSDEAESSSFLQGWNSAIEIDEQTVNVGPLTEEESLELCEQTVPENSAELREQILEAHRESGGNAFFLKQLLTSLDQESDQLRLMPFREVLSRRLLRLPKDARPILEMLSVYGSEINFDQVGPLAALESTPADTLTRMRNEQLIRWLGNDQDLKVDTYHDQVREEVQRELSEEQRVKWHLQIAKTLEGWAETEKLQCEDYPLYDEYGLQTDFSSIPHLFELANHYFGAQHVRAIDYLILAGEQCIRTYSNVEAVNHFDQALSLLTDSSPQANKFRILSGLAIAKLRLNLYDESIEVSKEALSHASCDMDRVLLYDCMAMANGNLGYLAESIRMTDRALEAFGRPRPKSSLMLVIRALFGLLRSAWFPKLQLGTNEVKQKKAIREFQIYANMRPAVQAQTILSTGLHALVKASSTGLQSGNTELETLGHAGTFSLLAYLQFGRLAKRALHRAEILESEFENQLIACRFVFEQATGSYFLGELESSSELFEKIMTLSRECGDGMVGTYARHFNRHVIAWRDKAGLELQWGKDELQFARNIKNTCGEFWGLYACADPLARAGRLPESTAYIQEGLNIEYNESLSATAIFNCTQAYHWLQASRYDLAVKCCQISWKLQREILHFIDYSLRCLPLWIQGLLGPEWVDSYPHNHRRELRFASRRMWFFSRIYKTIQPLCFQAWGRISAAKGKPGKAVRLFEKAVSKAKQNHMPYYQAIALLDLAAVKEEGREANRSEAIELLKQMESVIPRAESWLLGDQFDEAVVAPEFDLEAWEAEHGVISRPAREGENE